MVAVNQHRLVPTHTVLTKDEAEKLLETLQVTITEIPKILINDAALDSLEAKAGDIVCIERFSRITGTSKYYRVVVNE